MPIVLPTLKWDKAIDGVDFAGLALWMEDYHRSLLPPDTVFPCEGQIWETIRDCELSFEACFLSSGTLFDKLPLFEGVTVKVPALANFDYLRRWGVARLQKAEQVRVVGAPQFSTHANPKPLRAILQPLHCQELEASIVPQELRKAAGYRGYRLHVSTARPKLCLQPATA